MALDTTDILAVQKAAAGPGSVRKALVSDFLDLVSVSISSFWTRSGTELSPVNAGDDLTGVGNIEASSAAFTGEITAGDATFDHLEATDIDGGHKDLSPGEVDYPDP